MPHNQVMPADHPSPIRLVSAAAAMTVVMLVVAAIGEWLLLPSAWVQDMDEGGVARATALLEEIPGLHDAAVWWAAASGPWVVHPVVAIVAITLVWRHRVPRTTLFVIPIGLIGWALGAWCKEIVDRPRPRDALVEVGSWSYPSGHATNIALGAVLLVVLLTAVRTAWLRWGVSALVVITVVLTAADRLVLGVHNPSDVLAGLVLGAVMALVGLHLTGVSAGEGLGVRSSGGALERSSTDRRR